MQRQGRLDEAERHFSEARRHETTGKDEIRHTQDRF
jgi:hypothetical protein